MLPTLRWGALGFLRENSWGKVDLYMSEFKREYVK